LDVLNNEVGCVEALGLGVRLGVLQKAEEKLSRLDGPAGTRNAKLLACMQDVKVVSNPNLCPLNTIPLAPCSR
jgi:hypothetical protein